MVYHTTANELRTTRIVSVGSEGPAVKTFVFIDEECASAEPGQFLMLWVPGVDEIPLSIMDARKDGRVAVAVKVVGDATQALHQKRVGDTVGVRGPFGNSFRLHGRKPLLVGGGTGVAPLLFLTRKFVSKGVGTAFVLGARTMDELLFRGELEKLGRSGVRLVTSTEDGSCGVSGLCTEPVEEMLTKERFDMVYACGPEQMILKVIDLAKKHGVDAQASLERLMRCAIGLCGSCTIGKYRVCKDGPVFTSGQLREAKAEFGLFKRDRCGRKVPLD